jgi:hypothetical protein
MINQQEALESKAYALSPKLHQPRNLGRFFRRLKGGGFQKLKKNTFVLLSHGPLPDRPIFIDLFYIYPDDPTLVEARAARPSSARIPALQDILPYGGCYRGQHGLIFVRSDPLPACQDSKLN